MNESTRRLNISTRSGKVRVVGGEAGDVRVSGGTIAGERDGVTDIRRDRGSDLVEVRCPAGTNVTVGTVSGRIDTEGALGEVHIVTVSGKVHVADATRVDVRAKSGNIEIENCAGECRIVVTSAKVRIGKAQRVMIAGVSGVVIADGVEGAEVKTVSGKVLLGTTGSGDVRVRTVSGKVEIRVPPDVRPETRLRTISGSIKNDCAKGQDGEIAVASVSGTIRVSCA